MIKQKPNTGTTPKAQTLGDRPQWVPEWIWEGYLAERKFLSAMADRIVDDEYARYRARIVERMDRIIISAKCACVWRTMDKRRGHSFVMQRPYIGNEYISLSDLLLGSEGGRLILTVSIMADGIPRSEAFSVPQRRQKGKRIEKLARDLLHALREIDLANIPNGASHLPDPLRDEIFSHGNRMAEVVSKNIRVNLGREKYSNDELREAAGRYGALQALAGVTAYEGLLSAIQRGARAWANTSPMVTQLNSKNAARQYFINKLTNHFRQNYGTPLREQVAALTSVLFNCKMDATTIAKLAP